jgi:hypothetical protein
MAGSALCNNAFCPLPSALCLLLYKLRQYAISTDLDPHELLNRVVEEFFEGISADTKE